MPVTPLFITLISCCSVMWVTKPFGRNASCRFIVTGGTIMTMTEMVKNAIGGTGGCGICLPIEEQVILKNG